MVSKTVRDPFIQRHAWIILFVLAILFALSSLAITFTAGTNTSDFEASTGVAFEDMPPRVAAYFLRLTRLTGIGFFGFTLYALMVTFYSFRKRVRWAWYAMWVFPLVLGGTAAIFFLGNAQELGLFYGGAALVSLAGLLVSIRNVLPEQGNE